MKVSNLKRWLTAIKILLWIGVLGFGLTLFYSTSLVIRSDKMRTEVILKKATHTFINGGDIVSNMGIYTFSSDNILDKVIFSHTYGTWDFIQTLFTFIICLILLRMAYGINADSPFTFKTARSIGIIGLIFIAYGLIDIGGAFYMRFRISQITDQFVMRYVTFPNDLTHIKIGIFIIVFSLIYRVGAAYQQENQLTI